MIDDRCFDGYQVNIRNEFLNFYQPYMYVGWGGLVGGGVRGGGERGGDWSRAWGGGCVD